MNRLLGKPNRYGSLRCIHMNTQVSISAGIYMILNGLKKAYILGSRINKTMHDISYFSSDYYFYMLVILFPFICLTQLLFSIFLFSLFVLFFLLCYYNHKFKWEVGMGGQSWHWPYSYDSRSVIYNVENQHKDYWITSSIQEFIQHY